MAKHTMTTEQVEQLDWATSSIIGDYKLGKYGYGPDVEAKAEKLTEALKAFRETTKTED